MGLTNIKEIKELLQRHQAWVKKHLGQHFILSPNALTKMIEATEIKKNDLIIEVGPGLGTLTQKLAETGAQIIAIEKDPLMAEILKETIGSYENVQIVKKDARRFNWASLKKYKITANLPYNIASFLIRLWLESKSQPQRIVIMVQKEVAERLVAKPPKMNLLGLAVQHYAQVKVIKKVPKGAFWPQPKVNSSIIWIEPKSGPKDPPEATLFLAIAKIGFQQKRKQILGSLKRSLIQPEEQIIKALKKAKIKPQDRPQDISLEKWLILAKSLRFLSTSKTPRKNP